MSQVSINPQWGAASVMIDCVEVHCAQLRRGMLHTAPTLGSLADNVTVRASARWLTFSVTIMPEGRMEASADAGYGLRRHSKAKHALRIPATA